MAISSSAIVHLALLLDDVDLDGTLLLAGDLADGLTFERGRAVYTVEAALSCQYSQAAGQTAQGVLAGSRPSPFTFQCSEPKGPTQPTVGWGKLGGICNRTKY
jgi:hypothetical protein